MYHKYKHSNKQNKKAERLRTNFGKVVNIITTMIYKHSKYSKHSKHSTKYKHNSRIKVTSLCLSSSHIKRETCPPSSHIYE